MRTAGTNCDQETAFAFSLAGAETELAHINRLVSKEKALSVFQILALPGGFSYGDDIAPGKIFANELKFKLLGQIRQFIQEGKLIIGICNGFQILVKAGLLPGNDDLEQEVTLSINDSGKFEDRWVYLKTQDTRHKTQVRCVWTKNIPAVIYLPVAHGEGKFIAGQAVLERLKKNGQVVFQYCGAGGKPAGYPGNPNGSLENIAGISDETGRIFGLMPHPERHSRRWQHPRWSSSMMEREPDGLKIFKNGVAYAKKYL